MKILRLSRHPVDAGWLFDQLSELERLADEGDTLEVVAKLGSIVRSPTLEGSATELTASSEALRQTEAQSAPSG